MITAASLKEYTCKDLAEMAKQRGIAGWHAMRKDQLIHALVRKAKTTVKGSGTNGTKSSRAPSGRSGVAAGRGLNGTSRNATVRVSSARPAAQRAVAPRSNVKRPPSPTASSGAAVRRSPSPATKPKAAPAPPRTPVSVRRAAPAGAAATTKKSSPAAADPQVIRQIQQAHEQRERLKDIATENLKPAANNGQVKYTPFKPMGKERVVLMIRDPYWLHAYWELTNAAIVRAKAAMAELWHTARPILRLIEVSTGHTTATAERVVRDITIHGGVQNWYIDVVDPPKSYRVEIGYLADADRFHSIARSNTVQTPRPGSSEAMDLNWADVTEDCDRIFALSGGFDPDGSTGELQEVFEERFKRPMGGPLSSRFGGGAELSLGRSREFKLEVDAEMVIFGRTEVDSHISLAGEPVKLRPDGTFSVRVHMPDRRQVLPVVGSSSDGMEQRTVVLAVERNTKVMEPVMRDNANE